jgi:predicted enzyme related to lactoylglutathione lyase
MGNYATGTAPCGGVMGACAQVPRPSWNYCIAAESVAAADRAFARGGQILHGPVRSAQGAWIAQSIDPQGAHFAMVTAGK